MSVPPVLKKIVITGLLGALTFLATTYPLDQEAVWILTVFISGVTLVVQYLIDFDERLDGAQRKFAAHADAMSATVSSGFSKINEATELFGLVERSALRQDPVIQLVRNATQIDADRPLVAALAEDQIARMSEFLKELNDGDALYDGEDRDWLLGLTRHVRNSIEATSTMTADAGGVDFDGGFWTNDIGRRYLDEQGKAVKERKVEVRRIFVLKKPDLVKDETFMRVYRHQKAIGIDVRVVDPTTIPITRRNTVVDFILFDNVLSYEVATADTVEDGAKPTIVSTRLVLRQDAIDEKARQFRDLWDVAQEIDL